MTAEIQKQLEDQITAMVTNHKIAMEQLTERQMADAIKQAILAGDFQRHVHPVGQTVLYIPYQGLESLRSENERLKKLLDANGISHWNLSAPFRVGRAGVFALTAGKTARTELV